MQGNSADYVIACATVAGVIVAAIAVYLANEVGNKQVLIAQHQVLQDFRSMLVIGGGIPQGVSNEMCEGEYYGVVPESHIRHLVNVVLQDPELTAGYLMSSLYDEHPSVVAAALVVLSRSLYPMPECIDSFTAPDCASTKHAILRERVRTIVGNHDKQRYSNELALARVFLNRQDLRSLKTVPVLHGASFRDACLVDVSLNGVDLADANFTGADMLRVELEEAELRNSQWVRTRVRESLFRGVRMEGANLGESDFSSRAVGSVVFARNVFRSANLSDALLSGGDFSTVDFCFATLEGARVDKTDLRRALLDQPRKEQKKVFEVELPQDCKEVSSSSLISTGVLRPEEAKIGIGLEIGRREL